MHHARPSVIAIAPPPPPYYSAVASVWLAVVLIALSVAAWRAAGSLSPTVAVRTLVAAVLVCGFAVLSSMVLGVVRLGGNGLVLGVVALVASAAVMATVPHASGPSVWEWLASLDSSARLIAGALTGLVLLLALWTAVHPLLGFDAIDYHLAEALHWVKHGDPGSTYQVSILNPYGSFPLVDEIFNGWLLALGRGFAPVMLWPVVSGVLLGMGSWVALRTRGVTALPAALATASILTGPFLVGSLIGPGTDLSSLAWLTAGAALLGLAPTDLGLAGPGLLAIGLSIGTKSTVLPYGAALVAVWLFTGPWRLLVGRRLATIGLAAAGAIVGGLCYVRNLVVHGSPLWPTTVVPWGDPRPPGSFGLYATFAGHMTTTLRGHVKVEVGYLSGECLLLGGAVLVLILCRRRLPVVLGAATVVGVLLFAIAPTTGIPPGSAPVLASTHIIALRYLLPAVLPAAGALAFAADIGQRWLWCGLLALATIWSLGFDFTSSLLYLPSLLLIVGGVAVGVLVALVAPAILSQAPTVTGITKVVVIGAAFVLAIAVFGGGEWIASGHFIARHDRTGQTDVRLLAFMRGSAEATNPDTIAMTPTMDALTAGTNLQRDVQFIGPQESCAQIRGRLTDQTIIVTPYFGRADLQALRTQVLSCLGGIRPVARTGGYLVYAGAPSPSA